MDGKSVQEWAAQHAGEPYVPSSVGPSGYDCSGFVKLVTAVFDPSRERLPLTRRQRLGLRWRRVKWAARHWREYRLVHESRVDR